MIGLGVSLLSAGTLATDRRGHLCLKPLLLVGGVWASAGSR